MKAHAKMDQAQGGRQTGEPTSRKTSANSGCALRLEKYEFGIATRSAKP